MMQYRARGRSMLPHVACCTAFVSCAIAFRTSIVAAADARQTPSAAASREAVAGARSGAGEKRRLGRSLWQGVISPTFR